MALRWWGVKVCISFALSERLWARICPSPCLAHRESVRRGVGGVRDVGERLPCGVRDVGERLPCGVRGGGVALRELASA